MFGSGSVRSMQIFVQTPTGKTIPIYYLSLNTVKYVKTVIEYRVGIPIDQQRLIFNKQELQDENGIIENGSTLYLVYSNKQPNGVELDREKWEKQVQKYSMFGDDSSDEEDEVVSYDGSRAKEKLKTFNKLSTGSVFGHSNISFIIHAIAIKILYSPSIQEAYYTKKKLHATESNIKNKLFDYDEITQGIRLAAEHIVEFQRHLQQDEVHNEILWTINRNFENFFNAFKRTTLSTFFEGLTSDDRGDFGYWDGNLVGRLMPGELGLLKMNLNDSFLDRISIPFDISQSGKNFSIDFFSNLRLHNRLDRRVYKHKFDRIVVAIASYEAHH